MASAERGSNLQELLARYGLRESISLIPCLQSRTPGYRASEPGEQEGLVTLRCFLFLAIHIFSKEVTLVFRFIPQYLKPLFLIQPMFYQKLVEVLQVS